MGFIKYTRLMLLLLLMMMRMMTMQMFEVMTAAGPNASWEVLESALYIMLAVAKDIEP